MDEELKTCLVNLESRLQKGVAGTETRLEKRMVEMETRINEHFEERIHHLETSLLRAFSDASLRLEGGGRH